MTRIQKRRCTTCNQSDYQCICKEGQYESEGPVEQVRSGKLSDSLEWYEGRNNTRRVFVGKAAEVRELIRLGYETWEEVEAEPPAFLYEECEI